MNPRVLSITLLLLVAGAIVTAGIAMAEEPWIDQFKSTVLFYQQSDPHSDWQPYLDHVATIRDGLVANNEAAVQSAEGELIRMLATREHGINAAAAEDLFQMMTTRDAESFQETPVSVPDHAINTPYDGGRPCLPGGCDYWRDDVFDAGAG